MNDDVINNVKLRFYWLSDSSGTKIGSDAVEVTDQSKNSDFQNISTDPSLAPDNALFAEVQGYVYLNSSNPINPSLFDDLIFEQTTNPTPTPTPAPTNTPVPTSTPVPTNTPTPKLTSTPTPKLSPSTSKTIATQEAVLGKSTNNSEFQIPTGSPQKIETFSAKDTTLISKILISIGIIFLVACAIVFFYPYVIKLINKYKDEPASN